MTEEIQTLELTRGPLRLALRPDLGGCIAGLWFDDLPVLRSTEPAALERSRLSGCYPLLPYSNRLGYRRFRWHGREYTTQPNFDDNPHSVHGIGWQRAWTVDSAREDEAVLALQHAGDADWPFPFSARQTVSLTDEGLHLGLSITNTGNAAAPFGLGWHPYFPKRQRSRLHIELTERWDSDAAGLPTRRVPQAGIDGDVTHLDFDHCFEGWSGPARVRDEKLALRLTSSLPYLVVFTPPLKDYYCVEPVSHVSNAIHMAEPGKAGLTTLMPGEQLAAWFKLEISRP
ncbi:MAG: aldose 1-epimerase [Burkholderiaceae bacterium]|nr:aldose 1-epimerase [Rhodoferax sp.]MCP5286606.1 aldose 1-epimerase [Burkholderiaceae bacterium]